jgi:hypothetical protein
MFKKKRRTAEVKKGNRAPSKDNSTSRLLRGKGPSPKPGPKAEGVEYEEDAFDHSVVLDIERMTCVPCAEATILMV